MNKLHVYMPTLVLVVLYTFAIFNNQSAVLEDQRVFWLHDDMMISMRYARNLVEGQGLVWNPGEARVEGFTNPGWLLIMSAVHLLPLPDALVGLPILLFNTFLAAVVLVLTARLMEALGATRILVFAALLTLLLSTDLFRWATIGMETTFLTAVFLLLVLRIVNSWGRGQPWWFYLAAGALGLIRADGLILIVMVCLLAFASSPLPRREIPVVFLALLLPLSYLVFRWGYYGQMLPNTYTLKMTGWSLAERLAPGLRYGVRFVRGYGILWGVAGINVVRAPDSRARLLWGMGLPLLGYAIYVGGDDFGGLRFISPWLPVLIALSFSALPRLLPAAALSRLPQPILYALFSLTLILVTLFPSAYRFTSGPSDERYFARAGLILREITLPETSIGVYWAGTLPYFARRPAVDMLGKNDAYVAGLPAFPGADKPGHNKFDYTYSLGQLQPDLLVGPVAPGRVADPAELARLSEGPSAYAGQLYLHPMFQENYAPDLLAVGGVPIFIRTDSAENARLMSGECEQVGGTAPALVSLGMERVCSVEFGNQK